MEMKLASPFPLEAIMYITLLLSLHTHTAMSVFPVAVDDSYMTSLDRPWRITAYHNKERLLCNVPVKHFLTESDPLLVSKNRIAMLKHEFFKLDRGVSTSKAPLDEVLTVVHFCHHISMQSLFYCIFSHCSGWF